MFVVDAGVGRFLAWQIFCDLMEANVLKFKSNNTYTYVHTYTIFLHDLHMSMYVVGSDDWVLLGPGALSGLSLIFPGAKISQETMLPLAKQVCTLLVLLSMMYT